MTRRNDLSADINPLWGGNKLKLGIFSPNCSNSCAMTTADGAFETTWPNAKFIAQTSDKAGLELLVPVARWKGFGGSTNFNGRSFETYTWAAGVAACTDHIGIIATSHVATVHPVVAAKQATTIDHISNGRFGLNIVCGWFQPELEMFGTDIMEHDERYVYAGEWLDVVRRLWSSDEEFDFNGKYFRIRKGIQEPKPVQRPFPAIMNAGGSSVGQQFAAKEADVAFVGLEKHDEETIRRRIGSVRTTARDEFKRPIDVWINSYVVCRPTEKEAREYLDYYVREKGDWEGVDNLVRVMMKQSQSLPQHVLEEFKFHFIAGWGGFPLVGTPEQIADRLLMLSRNGLDGTLVSFVNYQEELPQFIAEVLPLLEQAGVREKFAAGAV